ncbi:hypothetical protein OHB24_35630 [Kribbella sp. NBC_00482]|uniref:hypothetical protein n=1 Tax=Kribbella sp. NBC_00482 TaxID=2975968 RepID=UPI002E16B6B5
MRPSDEAGATWFDSLGGWSNLLQGLGSAVIGGLVAAATAYLVVRWTHRSNMRAATEMDARSVVRSLTDDSLKILADIQELISQPVEDAALPLRRFLVEIRLCQMRFGTAFNVSFPTIALVDTGFVTTTISPLVEQISTSFGVAEARVQKAIDAQDLSEQASVAEAYTKVAATLDTAASQINDLNLACVTWLGART